ncbi:ABC transporter ATP-binding protein [Lactiplantibacillus plantarum]|nr:ABC transporter ATP-binding protein [Lactiplantibacillus plantarum]KZU47508.1 Aspartate aminotransferase [Lactiplantibacillus plantarum]QBJ55044.1 ABC transporter ATP-binding protein [Lactiplantibacillus plantarum]
MVNTILKEADLFCPNSVRINFTIYHNTYGNFIENFSDFFYVNIK